MDRVEDSGSLDDSSNLSGGTSDIITRLRRSHLAAMVHAWKACGRKPSRVRVPPPPHPESLVSIVPSEEYARRVPPPPPFSSETSAALKISVVDKPKLARGDFGR